MLVLPGTMPRRRPQETGDSVILDDFIMLGTTVPEPNKSDDRVFVCSAGYSPELRRLVRIYPLARFGVPHRWHQYRVPLERNPKDSRAESFQVRGDRTQGAHERINRRFEEVGKVKPAVLKDALEKYATVGSIAEADDQRLSLAILKPTFHGITFDMNLASPDSPQLALFDDPNKAPTSGSKRFPFNPRIAFTDDKGDHNLQLRDWGCYEWMRKYPDRHRELDVHLGEGSSLLVGNMNHQRNAWLVISVLNGIRDVGQCLFDV